MAIEGLKKHAGQLANTGVRVAVVFRKLPNDENSCLIVETERLPDSYHDYLMQCLNSKEAVETNDFYEVLNRRTFPDGLNCLSALHQRGHLRKEPVTNVTMLPLPGQAVPLALINATIDKKVDEYIRQRNEPNKGTPAVEDTRTQAEKVFTAEDLASRMQDPNAIAKSLILVAEQLEKDALSKREEAYNLAPELKPGPGRPAMAEDIKEQRMDERRIKRRERDREKAAQLKVDKASTALTDKINAKILRDAARKEVKTS
jgi:hypothetical protein